MQFTSIRAFTFISFVAIVLLISFGSTSVITGSPWRSICYALLLSGSLLAVWGPGLLIVEVVPSAKLPTSLRLPISLIAAAIIGWILFWVWFISPQLAYYVSAAVLGVTAVGLLARPQALIDVQVARPLLLTLLLACLYLFMSGDHGGFQAGQTQIAHRYWVSVDNKIPQIFADLLIAGRDALRHGEILPAWQVCDRPPLQTAMLMTTYPFIAKVAGETEAFRFAGLVSIQLGLAINICWVPALWSLLRSLRVGERQIAVVIVLLATVGAVYLNTIYAWPKMLAAAMTLCAASILLTGRRPASFGAIPAVMLASGAAALALLAHGGAAFGLTGLLPLAYRAMRRWGTAAVLAGGLTAVVIYAPWIGYQKVFDPPCDRLVKWHLAGTAIKTPDPGSPLEAIMSSYRQAGLEKVMSNKLQNFRIFLGDPTILLSLGNQPAWIGHPVRVMRVYLTNRLTPAAGLLLFGLIVLLTDAGVRRQPWVKPIVSMIALSALAFCLIEFGEPTSAAAYLHVAPYSLLLLWCGLGALALVQSRTRWSSTILAAHLISFYAIWVYGVTTKSAAGYQELNEPLDVPMVFGSLICAALIAIVTFRTPPDGRDPAEQSRRSASGSLPSAAST